MTLKMRDRASNAIEIKDENVTAEGYLYLRAKIARTGIQEYHASELGKTGDKFFKIYRSPEEVFDELAMVSFANKPVTNDHPPVNVTPDNFKKYTAGTAGDRIFQEGEALMAQLTIQDKAAIQAVRDGKLEISCGYSTDLDWTAGKTPKGEQYDAVQRKIRGNHIALVDAGRAGCEIKIQTDQKASETNDKEKIMSKTILVDGLQVEVTDAAAVAITKLLDEREARTKELKITNDAISTKDAELAANKVTLAARDKQIGELNARLKDEAFIDAALEAKIKAMDGFKAITGKEADKSLKTSEIIAAAVKGELADTAKDYTPEQFKVAFDVLLKSAKPKDDLADAIKDGGGNSDKRSILQRVWDEANGGKK